MKIAIAGKGFVGLSNAMLLAQYNEVVDVDIIPEKLTCSIVMNHLLLMFKYHTFL